MIADSCGRWVQCEEGPFNAAIGEQGRAGPPSRGNTSGVRSILASYPESIRYVVSPCCGSRLYRRKHECVAIGIGGVSGQRPIDLPSAILIGPGLHPSKRQL